MTEQQSFDLTTVQNTDLQGMLEDNAALLQQTLASKPFQLGELAIALDNALAQNEDLQVVLRKNPTAVKNAVLTAAMLGLRPGPAHRHFALVPFVGDRMVTCTPIIEWRGYIEVANQADCLETALVIDVVYEHEVKGIGKKGTKNYVEPTFSYDRMTGEIQHDVDILGEHDKLKTPDKMVAVYATTKVKGREGWATVVMTKREVEERRAASASFKFKPKKSPWTTHPAPMWKKTAARALFESGKIPMTKALNEAVMTGFREEETPVVAVDAEVTGSHPFDQPTTNEPPQDDRTPERAILETRLQNCVTEGAEACGKTEDEIYQHILDKHSAGTDPVFLDDEALEALVEKLEEGLAK